MQKFVIAATLTCAGIMGSTGASAAQLSPFNFSVAGGGVAGTMTHWNDIDINFYERGAAAGLSSPAFIPDQRAAELNAQVEDETPTWTPGPMSLFAFPSTSSSMDDATTADVPEPAGLALMGLALSSVALAIRRRPRS